MRPYFHANLFAYFFAMAAFFLFVVNVAVAESPHRVIVLGFDGMDYHLTRQWLEAGQLPNLATLARQGTFQPLETTNPPLSPVAWSTFITGMDPGGHGIFDFLRRDPAKVTDGFLPEDAVTTTVTRDSRLGGWSLPGTELRLPQAERYVLLRSGIPFWQLLENNGIPTVMYKVPASFPASAETGRVLAGMGVPDIAGTYGSFTYVTTRPDKLSSEVSGEILEAVVNKGVVQIRNDGQLMSPVLRGPINPFVATPSRRQIHFPIDVYVDQDARTAVIVIQDQPTMLNEGEWSSWVEIEFELLPFVASMHGLVRFYLQEAAPGFRLFVTPVHLAPGSDGLASRRFDLELAKSLGHFHTKGMPQETGAYTSGIFTADEYIAHSHLMHDETLAALDVLMTNHKTGLVFVYFSTLDLDSHVLWHYFDTEHPAHDAMNAQQHSAHIFNRYREMDEIVGRVLNTMGPSDQLYVISDHGFAPLRREFNLTRWLMMEGYLAYKEGVDPDESRYFQGVDWTRTVAYGVGFNGVYINRLGREPHGFVADGDYDDIAREIQAKLLALKDGHQPVFYRIYRPQEIYSGGRIDEAPDLILAYRPPFGPSDASILGTPGATILADRMGGFTGHHTTDASFVPGVLLSTRSVAPAEPRLKDITVTLLREFGVAPDPAMAGRSLIE